LIVSCVICASHNDPLRWSRIYVGFVCVDRAACERRVLERKAARAAIAAEGASVNALLYGEEAPINKDN